MINVKSTILDNLLSLLSPHYCCSCGEIGLLLCESCKYDITSEPFQGCLLCGSLSPPSGMCGDCNRYADRAWCVGSRLDGIEKLINMYKFEYAWSAHKVLGELLLARLPDLPAETIVTYIPTLPAHIRERGYDQTHLIAEYVADRRNLKLVDTLTRTTKSVQRGSSRQERIRQAKAAYMVNKPLDNEKVYLLIDDVVTTGSTLKYAARSLRSAGAETVWLAAIARQPFDKSGNKMVK